MSKEKFDIDKTFEILTYLSQRYDNSLSLSLSLFIWYCVYECLYKEYENKLTSPDSAFDILLGPNSLSLLITIISSLKKYRKMHFISPHL